MPDSLKLYALSASHGCADFLLANTGYVKRLYCDVFGVRPAAVDVDGVGEISGQLLWKPEYSHFYWRFPRS